MSAVNSIDTGSSSAAETSSTSSVDDPSGSAASALANRSGADGDQLAGIVNDLKSGLESGNSAKIGQAIGDLIALLKGAAEDGKSASAVGSGQEAGSPAAGESAAPSGGADKAGGSGDSKGGDDVLSLLQKLLEALGVPKDQIAKILNQAQESAVGGGESAGGATPGGESVSGVKAA